MDPDLITTIDRERVARAIKKEARDRKGDRIKWLVDEREKRSTWASEKSDLISFAKLLTLYFQFINAPDSNGKQLSTRQKEKKMTEFCQSYSLQIKALKEIHLLCFQLDRIMSDIGSEYEAIDFGSLNPVMPSKEEEVLLQ